MFALGVIDFLSWLGGLELIRAGLQEKGSEQGWGHQKKSLQCPLPILAVLPSQLGRSQPCNPDQPRQSQELLAEPWLESPTWGWLCLQPSESVPASRLLPPETFPSALPRVLPAGNFSSLMTRRWDSASATHRNTVSCRWSRGLCCHPEGPEEMRWQQLRAAQPLLFSSGSGLSSSDSLPSCPFCATL